MNLSLVYADIFDWPLTKKELFFWKMKHGSRFDNWREKNGFYVLSGREKLVAQRKKKEVNAVKKWKIARKVAAQMRWIPTLVLVGVTGGLSRNNVKENDDIDFFCITRKNTLWISRLLTIFFVELLGVRRRPNDVIVTDKICLNMFMSEHRLSLPVKERDLFAAHEVLQMVPLWERGRVYKKFLSANRWTKKFLPNAWEWRVKSKGVIVQRVSHNIYFSFITFLFSLLEPFARLFQLWYMKKRRTSEVVTSEVLRFHPRDARAWIKKAFEKRLSGYNYPLDKIFYRS